MCVKLSCFRCSEDRVISEEVVLWLLSSGMVLDSTRDVWGSYWRLQMVDAVK